ncbi:MAG: peptidoglycan-binding protein [Candidatus Paceibacterota bacterium]
MQKTLTFLFSILFIFSLFLSSSESLALTPVQTSTQAEAVADLSLAPECVEFKNNLTYLDRDSLKNGEVTKLQNFLASQGYFKESATGYFGQVTTKAVAEFQTAQGISPAVGYVGPVTKTKIKALSCTNNTNYPICDYAQPPLNCEYIQGPEYNTQTQCGLVLKCEDSLDTKICPAGFNGTFPNCVKDTTSITSCVELSNNLILTDRDSNKNGEVTKLQKFLVSKGYLKENPTGYFGVATLAGVVKFQKENNISPAIGYVGSLTRAKIKALSCGDITPSCPEGFTGIYPNCVKILTECPTGYYGKYPDCAPLAICDYAQPPLNCEYIKGPEYNNQTQCGLVLKCQDDSKVCPEGTTGTFPNCVTTIDPKPTVTLTATPDSVQSGGSTQISWTTKNATVCTASGGWTGTKATSGSQVISNLQTTTTFNLSCVGIGGLTAVSTDVGVYIIDYFPDPVCPTGTTGTYPNCVTTINPKPTVTISSNPAGIAQGSSTTLTWSSTNASTCTASGGWTGVKATSGSQIINSVTGPTTYNIFCVGPDGGASAKTDVNVYIVDNFPDPICPTGTTGTYPNCITTISYPAGCTSNTGFSTTTGQPCNGTILPCPAGTTGVYPNCVNTAVPSLIRTYPKGGETFNPGDTIKVTWEGKNLGNRLVNVGLTYNKYEGAYNYVESVFKLDLPNTGETSITIPSVAELKALGMLTNSFNINVWVHELKNGQYENVAFSSLLNTFKINIPCEAGQTGTYPNCVATVTPTPKPTVTITASPNTVPYGGSTTLSWSSTNATTCVASNSWSGSKDTSGTTTFGIYVNSPSVYGISCTGLGGATTASATVSVTPDTNTSYPAGCTSNIGFSTTTGQSCTGGASVSSVLTPRIAYWTGKAPQYVNSKGIWTSDINTTSVGPQQLLSFCKKWYPTTTATSFYKSEVISSSSDSVSSWINLSSGIEETFYGNSPSYKCIGGVQPTVLGASTTVSNSCSISQTLMKGMNNDEVKCLQQKLNQKGYTVAGTEGGKEVTQFGVATLSALRKFQAENGLTVDGILGLDSRNKINQ